MLTVQTPVTFMVLKGHLHGVLVTCENKATARAHLLYDPEQSLKVMGPRVFWGEGNWEMDGFILWAESLVRQKRWDKNPRFEAICFCMGFVALRANFFLEKPLPKSSPTAWVVRWFVLVV